MSNVLKMLSRGGAAAAETDPNFKQTVLLLHGDGTNGAQNNTFLDSSSNNFTITRNGNTTQGTFSPFSLAAGEWSNYFDGSGDFLDVPDNTALEIGASSFCIEAWINPNALPASGSERYIAAKWISASRSFAFGYVNTSGTIQLRLVYSTTGNTSLNISQNAAIVANTWQHIAITRDGTTARFFLNGVQQGSTQTLNATFWDSTEVLTIGRFGTGGGSQFDGYLSNLRVVIGSAVYTSNFTPSNTPLTAITNTRLLTCQSNRFVDNSTNAFAITANGDVRVTPFSPFAPSAAYSAGTNGGSGYFDTSGDSLTVPYSSTLALGTGDCTIEAWIYLASYPQQFSNIVDVRESSVNYSNNAISFSVENDGTLSFYAGSFSSSTHVLETASGKITLNAWYHVALTRASGTTKLYVNGVEEASSTNAWNQTSGTATALYIGNAIVARQVNGYISNLRIVKGTAVTPPSGGPTAPLTAVTNTQLLCNFTNAGIIDNTGKNNLETVGNAQIDTTTKKFGTGSLEFDGSGDYLVIPRNNDLYLGSGNFTAECWVYPTASPNQAFIMGQWSGSTGSTTLSWVLNLSDDANRNLRFLLSTDGSGVLTNTISSSALTLNAWNHVALVRNGSVFTAYLNGTAATGGTYTITAGTALYNATNPITVGATSAGTQAFQGYIDDLRITKGVARYTANFTAPTKEFPDQ